MSYIKLLFAGLMVVCIHLGAFSAPDIEVGKELFKNNCAACHNKNMKDALTGPALGPALEKWAGYPKEDFYQWVRNSQAMIKAGHPLAVESWNAFKPNIMTPFPNLTNDELESLMLYIGKQRDLHWKATELRSATTDQIQPCNSCRTAQDRLQLLP